MDSTEDTMETGEIVMAPKTMVDDDENNREEKRDELEKKITDDDDEDDDDEDEDDGNSMFVTTNSITKTPSAMEIDIPNRPKAGDTTAVPTMTVPANSNETEKDDQHNINVKQNHKGGDEDDDVDDEGNSMFVTANSAIITAIPSKMEIEFPNRETVTAVEPVVASLAAPPPPSKMVGDDGKVGNNGRNENDSCTSTNKSSIYTPRQMEIAVPKRSDGNHNDDDNNNNDGDNDKNKSKHENVTNRPPPTPRKMEVVVRNNNKNKNDDAKKNKANDTNDDDQEDNDSIAIHAKANRRVSLPPKMQVFIPKSRRGKKVGRRSTFPVRQEPLTPPNILNNHQSQQSDATNDNKNSSSSSNTNHNQTGARFEWYRPQSKLIPTPIAPFSSTSSSDANTVPGGSDYRQHYRYDHLPHNPPGSKLQTYYNSSTVFPTAEATYRPRPVSLQMGLSGWRSYRIAIPNDEAPGSSASSLTSSSSYDVSGVGSAASAGGGASHWLYTCYRKVQNHPTFSTNAHRRMMITVVFLAGMSFTIVNLAMHGMEFTNRIAKSNSSSRGNHGGMELTQIYNPVRNERTWTYVPPNDVNANTNYPFNQAGMVKVRGGIGGTAGGPSLGAAVGNGYFEDEMSSVIAHRPPQTPEPPQPLLPVEEEVVEIPPPPIEEEPVVVEEVPPPPPPPPQEEVIEETPLVDENGNPLETQVQPPPPLLEDGEPQQPLMVDGDGSEFIPQGEGEPLPLPAEEEDTQFQEQQQQQQQPGFIDGLMDFMGMDGLFDMAPIEDINEEDNGADASFQPPQPSTKATELELEPEPTTTEKKKKKKKKKTLQSSTSSEYTIGLEGLPKIESDGYVPLRELSNLKDVTAPWDRSDVPIFLHIPKAGGSTVKDIIGTCHRFVMASEKGVLDGHGDDADIAIVYPGGGPAGQDRSPFVNVDTTTVHGIIRAREMKFAQSYLADAVVTPYIFEVNDLMTPTAQGRLFTVFRHPIERAISMFRYIQIADWEETYDPEVKFWTIEQYAKSTKVENNWLTRQLSNQHEDDLTDDNLVIAKAVIRRKFVVGLVSNIEATMERFEKFFRWTYHVNPPNQELCRAALVERGSNANHQHNDGQAKPEPGSEDWKMLEWQNKYDLELYMYIEELFEEQERLVKDIPDGFRNIDATCCKCGPATYPPEGFDCPISIQN